MSRPSSLGSRLALAGALALLACVLAAILFPVFATAREAARRASPRSRYAAPQFSSRHNATDYDASSTASAPVAAGAPAAGYKAANGRLVAEGTRNPNLYLSNNYLPGGGQRDSLEKLINEGVLVQGNRVKLEAFTRRYSQRFPIPTAAALSLSAATQHARLHQAGGRTFLQVGVQAMKGEKLRRPPLNIALVMDVSGSMNSEGKLEAAKQAALNLVDRLQPADRLALVTFESKARLLVDGESGLKREQLRNAILGTAPGGGTNIYDGLELGYQEVSKAAASSSAERVNLVLLLSDGDVSSGVQDPAEFRALAGKYADQEIQTSTVGLGVDYNEELMVDLSRQGRGNYHFIRNGADTDTVFARELDELSESVAQALKLRVKLAEGVGFIRALGANTLDAAQVKDVRAEERRIDQHAYEELGIPTNRQREDEPGIKMVIPNFRRGDSHVVLLEVSVPPGHGTRPIAEVSLKYKDLAHRRNQTATARATVTYTDQQPEMIASIRPSVKKNVLGFQTGEALVQAAHLINQGSWPEAVKVIDERMVVLGLAAREWKDADLDADGRLLDRYKQVVGEAGRNPRMADARLGDYLSKSLTYSGFQRSR